MKILYLTHHWYNNSHHSKYSGFQRLAIFAAKRHEVTVITWGKTNKEYLDDNNVYTIELKPFINNPFFLRFMISFKGRQIGNKFDVIHSLYSDCAFFLKKNTFIMTIHVLPNIVKYNSLKGKLFIWLKYLLLQKKAIKNSKYISCVSTNLKEKIKYSEQKKTIFIPHGIDTEYWSIDKKDISSKKKNMVLCVGSHGVNVDQLNVIINSNPSYHFHMIGMKNFNFKQSNCRIYDRVSDNDLKSLYSEADILVRTVHFATANNSILEAMAMGCVVVTNNIPGIQDYLSKSTCIFVEDLADYRLVKTTNELDIIRNNAFTKIEENFSWEVVLKNYEQIYEKE